MAIVQEPRADNRVDSFVEAQIARARRRIQAQDVGIAALGLLAGALAYMLAMVVLDRWLDLSDTTRQLSLYAFLAAAVAYAAIILTRPLRREVNPYFAARRVEEAVPGAKNSLISWLDLHAEPLPESIHTAVSAKAAADLKRADVDEVVRDRRLPWLGGVAGGLFVAALILFFLLRPNQFLSLLGRAFTPFGSSAIASQTSLHLLQPAGGDLTVPVNTPVEFRVEVLGRVPDPTVADAVRLRFRYNPADPVAEEIRLDPSPREPREFSARVPANRVQTGFVYRVVGGDAATPEYRVQVRSSPLIESFEAVYHFRPYLRFKDQVVTNPNLETLRGTQVTLTARTNRTVKSGTLEFQPVRPDQKVPAPLMGEAIPNQPASLRFKFLLEEDATYKIRFQSVDGERNEDPKPYTIKVLSDHAPQVEVTQPAPDTLPVNGTLAVEGKASDDFGITAMRLCLQIADARQPTLLAPKPYRPGKVLKFADDTYPRSLDYRDFLPLEQLKTRIGAAPLKAGMAIEYWLEAVDNCDYPQPNVGKSKVYKVTLAEQQKPEEKQAAEKQAAGDKAQHDQKQDNDLNRQNDEKKQAGDEGQPDGARQEKSQEGDHQNLAENANEQHLEKELQKAQQALEKQRQREQQRNGNGENNTGQAQPGQESKNAGEPKSQSGNTADGNPQSKPDDPSTERHGENRGGQPRSKGGQEKTGQENQPKPGDNQQKLGPQNNNQAGRPNPGEQQKPDGNPSEPKPGGDQSPKANDSGANQQKSDEPKPQSQGGPPAGGDKKNPPRDRQQPGERNGDKFGQPSGEKPAQEKGTGQAGERANAGEQKAGNNAGKPDGEPNKGNPPGGKGQDSQPGQPNGTPPNQPPNVPNGEAKPTNGNRTPSEKPKKGGDGHESPPKPEPGAGGQPGNKGQSGERTGAGPKGDPNNRQPNGQPNEKDPGRDGPGSQKGSGQPGRTPDKPKPESAPNGQSPGGTPDAGQGKPKDTPANGSNPAGGQSSSGNPMDQNPGKSGGNRGQGDLQDAPKGGNDQPGKAPSGEPKSDGAPAGGQASGNKTDAGKPAGDSKEGGNQSGAGQQAIESLKKLANDLKSDNSQTRQAAEQRVQELAKELAKQGNGQKPPDSKDVQAVAERAKEMLKQIDKDPAGREALADAAKAVGEKMAKQELQKLAQDLKSADPKTHEAAKDRARQLASNEMKQLADDAKSGDPQRQQKADDALKQLGEPDPETRQALLDAMKGDGKPDDQKDVKRKGAGERTAAGQPPEGPSSAPPEEKSTAPDKRFGSTTADLQLEKFPKNPSKELLQDLGMTEEQYRQFLKDAAALQKKREAEAANNRLRGADRGKSAANTGAKRVEATGDKKDDLQRGGVTLPPEEYREGYKGFTEDVSKTSGGRAKKD